MKERAGTQTMVDVISCTMAEIVSHTTVEMVGQTMARIVETVASFCWIQTGIALDRVDHTNGLRATGGMERDHTLTCIQDPLLLVDQRLIKTILDAGHLTDLTRGNLHCNFLLLVNTE